ncbi:MAG: universal stress protein [Elioraea sp.]|nr:universal stress protein [Elioraea sp.]
MSEENGRERQAAARRERLFLAVVDDSPERAVALRYAALAAARGGGRVALLRVTEPPGQTEWAGVAEMMREERRAEAEQLLQGLAAEVNRIAGAVPILYVREGDPRDELLKLLAEEPAISVLVLASSTSSEGPGPLITALTGRYNRLLRTPLVIVPGSLTEQELETVT